MSQPARAPFDWPAHALVLALALPSILHLLMQDGTAAVLIVPAFFAARLLGGRRDERVWAVGVALSFALPLVPNLAVVDGFALERVFVHGALACLAYRGVLTIAPPGSGAIRWGRGLLLAWLALSLGSGLRGFLVDVPDQAPWLGEMLWAQASGSLIPRSMVEATHPLANAFLRVETVLIAWAGLQIAARGGELRRALEGALCVALPLGFAAAVQELVMSSAWKGESMLDRIRIGGVGRMHRPLTDHNALGSALVLALPVLGWTVWSRLVRRPRALLMGGLATLAFALGAVLLVTSRSKSALGGVVVSAGLLFALVTGRASARVRRAAAVAAAGFAALVVTVNLLPTSALTSLASVKYGEDVVRIFHRKGLESYLLANRVTVWEGGLAMVREEPLLGVGLGNFPRRLNDVRDPAARSLFNPMHENAHNQWLHWAAEEGLIGLALGLSILGLALGAAWRAHRRPPAEGDRLAWAAWLAALVGLVPNLATGHGLLVPTVAHWYAAFLAVCIAARPAASPGSGRRVPLLALVAMPVLFFGALAPALVDRGRPAPETHTFGCYPWQDLGPRSVPRFARVLSPDARWVERWGEGSQMLLPVLDVRPAQVEGEQRVTLELDGRVVVEERVLARPDGPGRSAKQTFLKVDRPADVQPGDLVEIRLRTTPGFNGSRVFDRDFSPIGVRALPIVFRDPGR